MIECPSCGKDESQWQYGAVTLNNRSEVTQVVTCKCNHYWVDMFTIDGQFNPRTGEYYWRANPPPAPKLWEPFNAYDQHPTHTPIKWRDAVMTDSTRLGYVDWVDNQLKRGIT